MSIKSLNNGEGVDFFDKIVYVDYPQEVEAKVIGILTKDSIKTS